MSDVPTSICMYIHDMQGLKCDALASLAALSGLTSLDVSLCRGIGDGVMHTLQELSVSSLNTSMCSQVQGRHVCVIG